MGLTVKDNTLVAVEIETTENTHLEPQSATSFVQTLEDGLEMTRSKERLDRNILTGSIGKVTPRSGIRSVSGTIPVEYRASETEGDSPEYDALLLSALGQKRSGAAVISGSAHTTSQINIDDLDIGTFNVGDIVMVKEAGAFHVSPVSATDDTLGMASITLLVPAAAAPADNVELSSFTTYVTANEGHPSLSISKYMESAVLQSASGVRVTSMALENFTTGQIASLSFGFDGMSFDEALTPPPFSPEYDDALPPIILNACVFKDGQQIEVNSLGLSVENVLGYVTSTCSDNGRISSRVTERTISGTIDPYKQDDSIENFHAFKCDETFSLFAFARIPAACDNSDEFSQVVAIYLPNCYVTEIGEEDQDGLVKEVLSFTASRGNKGTDEELYMGFM